MAAAALRLRSQVRALNTELATDVGSLWADLDAAQAEVILRDVLPDLIDAYGTAGAALAADWYDEERARAEAPRRFTAIPADIADTGTQALIGWAAAEATDLDAFRTLILGGAQRRIASFPRLTVTGSSIADPGARGWKRVGIGECDFCRMLLSRGAVYTEASADFEAHDHCHCVAAPAFL